VGELLDTLRAFCLPGGEASARGVRVIRTAQRGEMRSAPTASWIPFVAEETFEATRSGFRWDARLRPGSLRMIMVTDGYEHEHGWATIKLGGVIPLASASGPDFDKGELQRYLASIVCCPPSLLNHPSLEWLEVGPRTLRVRDRLDPTGASVDLEIEPGGRPLGVHAERPRAVGKRSVPTPWSGEYHEPRQWDGLRVPTRVEAAWHLPDGPFTYFRSEVTSLEIVR